MSFIFDCGLITVLGKYTSGLLLLLANYLEVLKPEFIPRGLLGLNVS